MENNEKSDFDKRKGSKNKAVFLDRDGTLIVDKIYSCKIGEIEILPGVIEGLRNLQSKGYLLIVITNQSGIARGIFTENELLEFNFYLTKFFDEQGIHLTKVYYCPHHPKGSLHKYTVNCDCRKPRTKLFWDAVREYNIELNESYAVGDRLRDCSICFESLCKGIVIGDNSMNYNCYKGSIYKCNNFKEAVEYIAREYYVW